MKPLACRLVDMMLAFAPAVLPVLAMPMPPLVASAWAATSSP